MSEDSSPSEPQPALDEELEMSNPIPEMGFPPRLVKSNSSEYEKPLLPALYPPCTHRHQTWGLRFDKRMEINQTRHYVASDGRGDMFSCTAVWVNFSRELLFHCRTQPPLRIYAEPSGAVKDLPSMIAWLKTLNPNYEDGRGCTEAVALWTLSFGREHLVECWLPEENAWHLDLTKPFDLLVPR
jgi:hypothetical protein